MGSVIDILKKTELVLVIAIISGLIISIKAGFFRLFIDYILGIVMFFSIRPFFQHEFNIHTRAKPILLSIIFNYVLLSGLFLGLAILLFGVSSPYIPGFVLLAIVPPAISIVPLCYLTHCDPETADASLFASFILSLIIIPVTLYTLYHHSIDLFSLIRIMLTILVVPMILAYFSRNSHNKIFTHTKAVANVGIGLVLFIAVSINRNAFFTFNIDILKIYTVIIVSIFGAGYAVYYFTKKYFSLPEAINFSLYASQKNEGTALAIAVIFFEPKALIPIVIALVCQFIYFMLFRKFVVSKAS